MRSKETTQCDMDDLSKFLRECDEVARRLDVVLTGDIEDVVEYTNLRRLPDYTFQTDDLVQLREVEAAIQERRTMTVTHGNWTIEGYPMSVKPFGSEFAGTYYEHKALVEIRLRPTKPPVPNYYPRARKFRSHYTTLAVKEPDMRIFEAVISKTDANGDPAEVVRVVPPFTAESVATAQKTVLLDYALEQKLTGKEAAALQVCVREFSGSNCK